MIRCVVCGNSEVVGLRTKKMLSGIGSESGFVCKKHFWTEGEENPQK